MGIPIATFARPCTSLSVPTIIKINTLRKNTGFYINIHIIKCLVINNLSLISLKELNWYMLT